MAMTRPGDGKKYKATYGVCVMCENIFTHGEYGRKDGLILCKQCEAKYEADTEEYKYMKYGGSLV